jgi:hypothetical protein
MKETKKKTKGTNLLPFFKQMGDKIDFKIVKVIDSEYVLITLVNPKESL